MRDCMRIWNTMILSIAEYMLRGVWIIPSGKNVKNIVVKENTDNTSSINGFYL